MKLRESYGSKQAAYNAMWRYVDELQHSGVHTGALRGEGGLLAQWVNNRTGKTEWASVEHSREYFPAHTRWYVRLSASEI